VPAVTTAGWLAPDRPEVYRPKGERSGYDDSGLVGRIVERMRPDEGWLSLPLVLLLTGIMAWSISDARWILGRNELTGFLIWVALAAALWGYLSARLDLSPWLAQSLGCVIGAFVLIEAVGASLPDATPGLAGWFHATANSVVQAYLDLTWRHQSATTQVGHFMLLLGILVWGTAQAASYDIFGYNRSVNGVLLLSVVFIANMALTIQDQLLGLVVFSAAALMLLLLAHAADERSNWLRHRIWRGRDFQAPHMQGGLAFASLAVVGSLLLTSIASSAPLASTVKGLGSNFQDAIGWLNGYLPNGGASRYQPSADFGTTAPISSAFHETTHDVFTVRVGTGAVAIHWRLVAYDTFQTVSWSIGSGSFQDQVSAGNKLDAGTQDLVGAKTPGRLQVSVVVHVQDTSLKHLIVVNEPDTVNVAVKRTLIGSDTTGTNVAWLTADATDYTVSSLAPDVDPNGTGLTEWRLSHAGTNYPKGLLARYTQGTTLVGSDGKALLAEIASWAKANGNTFDNEYLVAKAIQSYLQSSRFRYNADITGLISRCTGLSTVDCFAFIREGFCEQYATTMTMLMRMEGYPARYVQGYLPGAIAQNTLIQQVTSQQKHSWVEVFFPGYGWIPFDPTGGGVGQPTLLVPGTALASPSPAPLDSADQGGPDDAQRPNKPPSGGSTTPTSNDSGGPAALLPAALVAILLLAVFVAWRRRPRGLDEPDTVYRNVVKLASRLGYRPRPTQTVYEYTGMLAEVVPHARDSLGVVAMATVEVAYGRRRLGSERLTTLAAAQRVVRGALLRLALRIPGLRGRARNRGSGRGPRR
jgi:transglutaminase-like putative cysteine protease